MSFHTGHRKRMKQEFLLRGLEGWPDHRVLELLLFFAIPQGDTNDLAHALVEQFGSLAGVLDASPEELARVPGVGEHTISLLKLLPALGRYYVDQRSAPGEIVDRPEKAVELLSPYYYGARNELVYILCLDSKRKALGVRKVSEGSIYAADINIRRIVEEAMGLRAASLYLAHNHVSNLAFPSRAARMVFVDGDAVSLEQTQRSGRRPVYQLL